MVDPDEDVELYKQFAASYYGYEASANTPVEPKKPCPECKGTGKYIGFTKVEDCKICKGTKEV